MSSQLQEQQPSPERRPNPLEVASKMAQEKLAKLRATLKDKIPIDFDIKNSETQYFLGGLVIMLASTAVLVSTGHEILNTIKMDNGNVLIGLQDYMYFSRIASGIDQYASPLAKTFGNIQAFALPSVAILLGEIGGGYIVNSTWKTMVDNKKFMEKHKNE